MRVGSLSWGTAERTRVEVNLISSQLNILPNTTAVPPGAAPILWPTDNSPTVRVVSVDGQAAPADPKELGRPAPVPYLLVSISLFCANFCIL